MLDSIEKKAQKRGTPLDLSTARYASHAAVNPTISGRISLELYPFYYAMVKMAIGTAHYALGYRWSQSDDADRLRECLREPDVAKWPDVRGTIPLGGPSEDIKAIWGVGEDKYALALFTHGTLPLVFQCLLFGSIYGSLQVADHPCLPEQMREGGIVFVLDCRTRSLAIHSFGKFIRLRRKRLL